MPKTYEDPDRDRPFAEKSINLRLRALYLKRGHTRASFARALKVHYNVVMRWDTGLAIPTLSHFLKACELLSVTPTRLAYGDTGRPPSVREESLRNDEIVAAFDGMIPPAHDDEIEAFDRWRTPRPGQRLTATFVRVFVETYRATGSVDEAASAARTARAIRDADEAGIPHVDPAAFKQRKVPKKRSTPHRIATDRMKRLAKRRPTKP
jgi:transcriptional regulator with XRE-family HTH domain